MSSGSAYVVIKIRVVSLKEKKTMYDSMPECEHVKSLLLHEGVTD